MNWMWDPVMSESCFRARNRSGGGNQQSKTATLLKHVHHEVVQMRQANATWSPPNLPFSNTVQNEHIKKITGSVYWGASTTVVLANTDEHGFDSFGYYRIVDSFSYWQAQKSKSAQRMGDNLWSKKVYMFSILTTKLHISGVLYLY